MKKSDSEILHQPLLLPPPSIPKQEPPNPNPNASHGDPTRPSSPTPAADQIPNADVLSREEVLRRRFRCLKKLSRVYRDLYWALAEEIRVRHRDFYWQHGKSPLEEEGEEGGGGGGSGLGLRESGGENGGGAGERKKCSFSGCKSNSMPLTAFCHQHILSDREQKLYRPCCFVIRSIQSGPVICRKPVSAVPSLCPVHLQKTQRNISLALRKAGLTTSSPPKFHELIHELLRQIIDKRKKQKCRGNSMAEEESNRKPELDSTGRTDKGKMFP
ncbi:uncharacterized protein M6B38_338615 [Iris pallida]|uniref:KAT8 regulatory NSL complex subunit 2 n=1 Tax=Iris pallida TaxID=29817 RepID=A0AAX6GYE1_IRIPA|nr:uncharacterized protein M6B38_338615 [Iris pallida]